MHWHYYRSVWRQIPWGKWLSPLGYWMVFVVASYGMFYCLTMIVLGYWSDREKLIFPLAKLPESLVPEAGEGHKWWPGIFTSAPLWAGFAISFFVLTWNVVVGAKWVGGVGPISLGMGAYGVETLLKSTAFEGITGGLDGLSFFIIFTAIGIAFLLPAEISFSAWGYSVVGKVMILIAVWMGFGIKLTDFPTDWLWVQNLVSAQGAGGILLFSALSLWRCLRDYYVIAAKNPDIDRVKLSLPIIGLVVSLLVLTG